MKYSLRLKSGILCYEKPPGTAILLPLHVSAGLKNYASVLFAEEVINCVADGARHSMDPPKCIIKQL